MRYSGGFTISREAQEHFNICTCLDIECLDDLLSTNKDIIIKSGHQYKRTLNIDNHVLVFKGNHLCKYRNRKYKDIKIKKSKFKYTNHFISRFNERFRGKLCLDMILKGRNRYKLYNGVTKYIYQDIVVVARGNTLITCYEREIK